VGASFYSILASFLWLKYRRFVTIQCGHCKNLVPIYRKVATKLKGVVNVGAIDCDDVRFGGFILGFMDQEANKPTCGQFGIQGFPTIKMFPAGKSKTPQGACRVCTISN
jgi:protein disulfide-isomerase A6